MPDHKLVKEKSLKAILPKFNKYLEGEGKVWIEERKAKEEFFDSYFPKEQLDDFNEGTLRELIQRLWCFYGWTNKDYLVEEMLKSGIEKIREAFKFLIYADEPVNKRFDYVKENIRMMGAAGISEILTHFDRDCAIWSRRVREGLLFLGIDNNKLPKSSQLSGKQYEEFCGLANKTLKEVQNYDPKIKSLMDLDLLLFYISSQKYAKANNQDEIGIIEVEDFDHDYAIEQIAQLGDGLGFEVETEFNVAPGCRIDVLWRSRIANLGIISYAFEVHRRGSRDSAILNLQRVIKQDSSIQKVVIVSSKKEIEIFKNEISSLGEEFRKAIGYLEVGELEKALNHLDGLKGVLNNAGLLKM